jgi:hypothetical protein
MSKRTSAANDRRASVIPIGGTLGIVPGLLTGSLRAADTLLGNSIQMIRNALDEPIQERVLRHAA